MSSSRVAGNVFTLVLLVLGFVGFALFYVFDLRGPPPFADPMIGASLIAVIIVIIVGLSFVANKLWVEK